MNIYSKARAKITIGTVLVSLGIVCGLWLLLFLADYIMYTNNMPMLFVATKVNSEHVTMEQGLGYYAIKNTDNVTNFYLFGHKIK